MLKQSRQSLTPDLTPEHGARWVAREPYYLASGDEIEVFAKCHARGLPVMLKGPTGCGKTRFIEHMAWKLGRPLVTIACHVGLRTKGGTQGVGHATTVAVVAGSVAVIAADFFVTQMMVWLFY